MAAQTRRGRRSLVSKCIPSTGRDDSDKHSVSHAVMLSTPPTSPDSGSIDAAACVPPTNFSRRRGLDAGLVWLDGLNRLC